MPEIREMPLGAIEYRKALSPRFQLDTNLITEMVNTLLNGGTLPPIEVHPKGVLFDGAAIYHAYIKFYGDDNWRGEKVPFLINDSIPDPDEEPDLFRVHAAVRNSKHGKRLSRDERLAALKALIDKYGPDEAEPYAIQMGETKYTFRQWVAILKAREDQPKTVTPMPGEIAWQRPASEPKPAVAAAKSADEAKSEAPDPVAREVAPSSFPGEPRSTTAPVPMPGHLRSKGGDVIRACRELLSLIDQRRGYFTDYEYEWMDKVYRRLHLALDKWGEVTTQAGD